jgi:hypothetical protein
MAQMIRQLVKSIASIHRPDGSPNVFLFSTPRSGSTWLMELIWSQPGFKCCNEPLNLRKPLVRRYLGISEWRELGNQTASTALHRYFQGFCEGRLRFMNPNPFRRYYRPVTRRIVFKIIHGGEDRLNWFRDTFNGRIVYLLRHPIPVSLSREAYPHLEAFLSSDYQRHFTDEQLRYARKVVASGTKLERGVLAWCLQNAIPLREATADWAIVSYEQMVREPQPVIAYLADKLALPKPARMLRQLSVPSSSKGKSDQATQAVLDNNAASRAVLVEKWRNHVREADEYRAMEILPRFHLDAYRAGEVLPADSLWIKPRASRRPPVAPLTEPGRAPVGAGSRPEASGRRP